MEFVTVTNIITAIVIGVMLLSIVKIFTADVGGNRIGNIVLFVLLGIALYLWRSGTVMELFRAIGAITG